MRPKQLFMVATVSLFMIAPQVASHGGNTGSCDAEDRLVVGPAETVTTASDLTLAAECDIVILGEIRADEGSGASIELRAGRHVIVLGKVLAGSGADGADVLDHSGTARAPDGRAGGSVRLVFTQARCPHETCEALLLLAHGATVAAGAGGRGGDAVAFRSATGDESQPVHAVLARAGDGAAAGTVYAEGTYRPILGGLPSPSTSGSGGHAYAGGPNALAVGGAGADAVPVVLEGMNVFQWFWVNQAASAGVGGDAYATSAPGDVAAPWWVGAPITGPRGDDKAGTCNPGALVAGLLALLGQANDGDYDAQATGGAGGNGVLYGGHGGTGTARACDNPGSGTPGDDGNTWNPCDEPVCPVKAEPGLEGEKGPVGGTGTATGGGGAVGLLMGGDGGRAESTGGTGGRGGKGGKGADAIAFCMAGGDGGRGGEGGDGGKSAAMGGNGGNALLAAGRGGVRGNPGGASGPGGAGGEGGDPGNPVPVQPGYYLGCAPSPGFKGDVGDLGQKPQEQHDAGADGDAGTMSVYDGIDYLFPGMGQTLREWSEYPFVFADQCEDDVRRWLGEGPLALERQPAAGGEAPDAGATLCYTLLETVSRFAGEATALALETYAKAAELVGDVAIAIQQCREAAEDWTWQQLERDPPLHIEKSAPSLGAQCHGLLVAAGNAIDSLYATAEALGAQVNGAVDQVEACLASFVLVPGAENLEGQVGESEADPSRTCGQAVEAVESLTQRILDYVECLINVDAFSASSGGSSDELECGLST
jgi:hypothetical protein